MRRGLGLRAEPSIPVHSKKFILQIFPPQNLHLCYNHKAFKVQKKKKKISTWRKSQRRDGKREMINGVAEVLFKSQNGLYLGHSSHLDNEGDLHFKNNFYGKT